MAPLLASTPLSDLPMGILQGACRSCHGRASVVACWVSARHLIPVAWRPAPTSPFAGWVAVSP